jgi:hypothetical protein
MAYANPRLAFVLTPLGESAKDRQKREESDLAAKPEGTETQPESSSTAAAAQPSAASSGPTSRRKAKKQDDKIVHYKEDGTGLTKNQTLPSEISVHFRQFLVLRCLCIGLWALTHRRQADEGIRGEA